MQVAPAAANMAMDWLLLEAFPEPTAIRLRCYGWANPSWTFGYAQKWTEARQASGGTGDLIRRPTGGGLVNHQTDWTYALVLPAAHPLTQARACESYQAVHEAVAKALVESGVHCQLQITSCQPSLNNFSVCFQTPEPKDVVRIDDGRKIAGAAQKRTRAGLLLQGSIEKKACPEVRDWAQFASAFTRALGQALSANTHPYQAIFWPETAKIEAISRFSAPEWNQKR